MSDCDMAKSQLSCDSMWWGAGGGGDGALGTVTTGSMGGVLGGAKVAVLSTPSADLLVSKNNLSCADLLQPFCRISAEGQIRDPSGVQYIVKNFKLSFSNINARPPQPTLARKFLNESVSKNYNEKTISKTIGKFNLDIPASTPWFDAWRETFFLVQFPSDHEFTNHFVACLLVANASEPNPLETLSHMGQQLSQMQNVTPPKLPKWFNNNVLRCYLFLNDVIDGNSDKARRNFDSLKQSYGAGNCFLLSLNSANPSENENCSLPDPWNKYLARRVEVNDSGSEKDSLPRTPGDPNTVISLSNININEEKVEVSMAIDDSLLCDSATEASESASISVQIHPLSPTDESEANTDFGSGNSLQNDPMSNSISSDIGLINPNVWDQSLNTGGNTNIHGACLSSQDVENIKTFVQDFALKALLPYFERQIFQLQDAVSNKKGVSRSIFNATKRWFGTNKPGTNVPVNSVLYTGDCAELQLRRLGDIWFMLGQWNQAYQTYHTAKREYNSDSAWLCYAGALEMAALSAFMGNESSRKTFEYMEESIIKYLNACRMPQYAVRATLLSVQCLCNRGMYSEAARQLIRMTSEDCDLRSAILLEQAALCFLAESVRKASPRKYAFHMVLAGHRYSKAGQRKHSLRCYKHAYQVYRGGGWRLATDHIEFTVGRLAGQVRAWDASIDALSSLLAPRSLQPPAQQVAFLREYLYILHQWISNDDHCTSLPQLPIPLLESNMTTVLCGGISPPATPGRLIATGTSLTTTSNDKIWITLEKMLLHKAKGGVMIFKPTISLFSNTTDNSSSPITPQNEPIQLLIYFQNPLQIDITLADLQLLWEFKSHTSETNCFSNEDCIITSSEYDKSIMFSQKVSLVNLPSDKITSVTMAIIPLHPGELTITGVAYKLCNPQVNDDNTTNNLSVAGKQIFKIKGHKLKSSRENPSESQYSIDNRLKIIVVPPSPCLQVTFSEINNQLLCGELQKISVEFRNVGKVPLKALYMASSQPQYTYLMVDSDKNCNPFSDILESMYLKPPLVQDERQLMLEKEKKARNRHCNKILDFLDAGQSYTTIMWLQAPEQIGNHNLHVLFYYENYQQDSLLKHRLLRHSWNISLKESISFSALPKRTLKLDSNDQKYKEALNLAVEIRNMNQVHHDILTSVEIQQISLLSQNWKLTNFVPISRDAIILNSQETLHLVLCAKRESIENSDKDILFSDLNIKENDSLNILSIKEKPYSSFITYYSSIFEDGELTNEFYNIVDNINIDMQSLNSTLVIRWKADITKNGGAQRIAVGQHRIILDKLNNRVFSLANSDILKVNDTTAGKFGVDLLSHIPGVNSINSVPINERLITFCLEHLLEIKHDFNKLILCLVPVKIHIVNCSSKKVIAILNTSSQNRLNKCPSVSWVGIGGDESGGVQISLSPFMTETVNLQIACTFPGTYTLGNIIRVLCKVEENGVYSAPILQSHVASSTLIVVQHN